MKLWIDFANLKLVLSRLRMQIKQNLEQSRNSRYLGSKTWQGLNSSFENERGGIGGREGWALPSRNYNTKCHNYRPNHTLF